MDLAEQAYAKAIRVVEKCSTPHGLFASGVKYGYTSVWARDSVATLLGAALTKRKLFRLQFRKSLSTLARHQDVQGQIPNCVDLFDARRRKQVTFATIDSTLWFLVGEHYYAKFFRDKSLLRSHHKKTIRAFHWLRCQDTGNDGMPEQHPTSDWQDCFPHKYGHTISTQALYYAALLLAGKQKEAKNLKGIVNGPPKADLTMFDKKRGYFLPWIWKDHDGDREYGAWFDSLGNVLAVAFGLAERDKALDILDFIEAYKVNEPYSLRSVYPVINPGSKYWKSYFSRCLAGTPHYYLNGGIWPYIGGFYVAALVAAEKFSKAEEELEKLANANRLGKRFNWEFNEWINPLNGKAQGGEYQAWSAGCYLFAYHAVKERKVPVFHTEL